MAYSAGELLNLTGMAPGRGLYRYDSTTDLDLVEDAGYFNNVDDSLELGKGDIVHAFQWSATPFATASTLSAYKSFVVTNVISRDAAANAGAVNVAEIGVSTAGLISSGD